MSVEKLRIIAGPVVAPFDGDVARVVELPNGAGRIEVWKRGAGWVTAPKGSITPDQFMPGACRPVSANDAARLGIPLSDITTAPPASSSKLSAKDLRELAVKMAEADALLMVARKARQVAELDRRRPRLVWDRDQIAPPQV